MRLPAALLLLAILSTRAGAQASTDTLAHGWPHNGWVSLGFGTGSNAFMSSGFAGVASAWYTVGPVAMGVRTASTSRSGLVSSTDDVVQDVAALIGLRTPARRAVFLGALGYGRASVRPGNSDANGLAYSLQASVNYRIVGIAAELFGAEGAGRASFRGVALSLQLGWFGR